MTRELYYGGHIPYEDAEAARKADQAKWLDEKGRLIPRYLGYEDLELLLDLDTEGDPDQLAAGIVEINLQEKTRNEVTEDPETP
jgi:hypothetical protein